MFTFAEIFDQILKDEFIFPSTAWSLFHCHCNAGGWACLVIGSSYSTTAAGDKLWLEKYQPLLNKGADRKMFLLLFLADMLLHMVANKIFRAGH